MAEPANRLLQVLSPGARARLLAVATPVRLPQRATLSEPNERTHNVYFLTAGLASLAVTLADGGSAEIAVVGNEGLLGFSSLLGPQQPVAQCFMQIAGAGLRIPVADLRKAFNENEEIRSRILESVQGQTLAMHQLAACNKLHHATERFARWLLTAADRTASETLALTQEALSQMLGTRRTTVALVAGALQRSGVIRYRRGNLNIVDREGLEAVACDCYAITRRLAANLYAQR